MAKDAKERIVCSCCGESRLSSDYYASQSHIYKYTKKLSVCKYCIWEYVEVDGKNYNMEKMKDVLQMLDKPFTEFIFERSENEAERDDRNVFKTYMKNLGMRQYRYLRLKDGDIYSSPKSNKTGSSKPNQDELESTLNDIVPVREITEEDNKNKEDVLRMLGYDPFESENRLDKVYLYNRLVDFLDESTLEDSFKLPAVIEIVKAFNQIDKINLAISKITSSTDSVSNNVGSINQLITAKEKMLKSSLKLAEDNGISVKHSLNKSKGAGTLSGIMKSLQEKGFEEVDVNLFDIETAKGMRQVADMSNESISKQLQFDENDYTEMINEQKDLIVELDSKYVKSEEENRKLKKEILRLKNVEMNSYE